MTFLTAFLLTLAASAVALVLMALLYTTFSVQDIKSGYARAAAVVVLVLAWMTVLAAFTWAVSQ